MEYNRMATTVSSGIDLRENAHQSLYFQVIGQFYDLFY